MAKTTGLCTAAAILILAATAGAAGPAGIYVLGSAQGDQLAGIRDYDFVSGYTLRTNWSQVETGRDSNGTPIYSFDNIRGAIQQLQAIDKGLTLEIFTSSIPAHILNELPANQTFIDRKGVRTARPWSEKVQTEWARFQRDLASLQVLDTTSSQTVPLAQHPTLVTIDAPIPGVQSVRDIGQIIIDLDDYTRQKFVDAVVRAVHASRDVFPNKFGFLAIFSMSDSYGPGSEVDLAILDRLRQDFNNPGQPTLGYFQENLADATPKVIDNGLTRSLDAAKGETYILFQALTSWLQPFGSYVGSDKIASGNPATGIAYAWQTWSTRYVEIYVPDADGAADGATDAAGRPIIDDLRYWNTFLTQAPQPYQTFYNDVVFATVPTSAGSQLQLRLDLYRPPQATGPVPLVIYIHGGGWRLGSHNNLPSQVRAALDYGLAVASIEYRLIQETLPVAQQDLFPKMIHDVKGAVRFLRAGASAYGLNPDRFGAWGPSAGGHLAALLGTSADVTSLEGDVGGNLNHSSRVQAIVDYYGPADTDNVLIPVAGYPPPAPATVDPAALALAAPITHASTDDPPFFIAHSTSDTTVRIVQSERLTSALQSAGVSVDYHPIAGGVHSFESMGEETNDAAVAFLVRRLSAGTARSPADINGDSRVDIFDLLYLANAWNTTQGHPLYRATRDLNADGAIDIFDLLILANDWNR